ASGPGRTIAGGGFPRAHRDGRTGRPAVIRAFAFLITRSTRNKLVSQIKRLRSPRYAIALALGIAYFWLVVYNRSARTNRPDAPTEFFDTLLTLLPLAALVFAV